MWWADKNIIYNLLLEGPATKKKKKKTASVDALLKDIKIAKCTHPEAVSLPA